MFNNIISMTDENKNQNEIKDFYGEKLETFIFSNILYDNRNNKELHNINDDTYINISLENDKFKLVDNINELKLNDIIKTYLKYGSIRYSKIIKINKKMITIKDIINDKCETINYYFDKHLHFSKHYFIIDNNSPLDEKARRISKNDKYIYKLYSDNIIIYEYYNYNN